MSANLQPLVATIYNPHNQSKEALIAGFIARKQKFERLFRDIRDAPMTKPEQHYLIQGIRGMGKTTFLLRLAYEIENTPELRQRLVPVVFNEEEYGIGSLADVWERTAHYLEEDQAFAGLYETIIAQFGQTDYERLALQTILTSLRERGQKLLLMIDNIGDLLKKLDDKEAKRLREVLLTTPDLRLIGTTAGVIHQAHDYTRPFYEFFKVTHLEGLTRQETLDLFLKLGELNHAESVRQLVERQPGRIEALRRLTGGVVRTMVLLFEILAENNGGSVFRDLNRLLDLVTPLYKHRLDDLPPQQQKIVAALAQAWDAANARELAQAVRLESRVVSAQLTQLINNGLVEKVETRTKNHLYRLEERFFNIWYLMRFGRRTDQRVLWLVRFFEEMFGGDADWMQERLDGHLQAMETDTLDPEAALYLTTAFAGVLKDEEVEDLMKKKTRVYLLRTGRYELAKDLKESAYEKVTKLIDQGKYKIAVGHLERLNKKTPKVHLDLAACYIMLDDLENYNLALEKLMTLGNSSIMMNSLTTEDKDQLKLDKTENISTFIIMGVILLLVILAYHNQKGEKSISTFGQATSGVKDEMKAAEISIRYFYSNYTERKKIALSLVAEVNYFPIKIEIGQNYREEDLIACRAFMVRRIIELWNNDFRFQLGTSDSPFSWVNAIASSYLYKDDLGETYLKLLLAKKQYHTAYNYFQHSDWQLKDRYKPLYYATLHFLRDEYPTDYLRMGPELHETVDDLLAEIGQMAIDYA